MSIYFLIESGKCGPGPTYKTLEKVKESMRLGYIFEFPEVVYSLSEVDIEVIQKHVNVWCVINDVTITPDVQNIQSLLHIKHQPLTIITGFVGAVPMMLQRELGSRIKSGSEVIVANGVLGYPSYIMKYQAKKWSISTVNKSLARTSLQPSLREIISDKVVGFSSLKIARKVNRVILNNPFNWPSVSKSVTMDVTLILKNILDSVPGDIKVDIICKNQFETSALQDRLLQLDYLKGKNIEVHGPEYCVNTEISSDDLVIAEGVGTMEDCLMKGAIGIQILKWQNAHIPNIYSSLLNLIPISDNPDRVIFCKYLNFDNNNLNVCNLIIGCFSDSKEYRDRFNFYCNIFDLYREHLFSSDKTILQSLLELSDITKPELLCRASKP